MLTTSVSLLHRLRQSNDEAWSRFVNIYTPVLFAWARKMNLANGDAQDLVQDVFMLLLRKLPEFTYNPKMRFRSWLRTVACNRFRDFHKQRRIPTTELDDAATEADPFWEGEFRRHVVRRALDLMQQDFEETTWKACWMNVAEDRSGAEVAKELGITVNAVYLAKSRVLRRLHQELEGMWE